MKRQLVTGLVLLAFAGSCLAQTVAPDHVAAAAKGGPADSIVPEVAVKRTDKQIALATQTDRLAAMANELKDQVDKTNKNILSLKVVQKAEEIEQLAHKLKEQSRK